MSQQLQKVPKNLTQRENRSAEQTQNQNGMDSTRGFFSELLHHGGVSLQNVSWQMDSDAASIALSITMDLLEDGQIGASTAKQLREFWPAGCWPLVLIPGNNELNPGLSSKTRTEILNETAKSAVDLGLHSLRLADDESADFDRVFFSYAFPIGSERVVLGVAFSENTGIAENVSQRLRDLLTQLESNQITINVLGRKLTSSPNARLLVRPETKEVVWRNRVAVERWESIGEFVTCLLRARYDEGSNQSDANSSDETTNEQTQSALALITFLRPALSEIDSSPELESTPVATRLQYGTPPSVRRRLHQVLYGLTLEQNEAMIGSTDLLSVTQLSHEVTMQGTERDDVNEKTQQAEEDLELDSLASASQDATQKSKTALEFALNRLPKGGKLRLSRDEHTGEMFFESLDKEDEPLATASLQQSESDSQQARQSAHNKPSLKGEDTIEAPIDNDSAEQTV